MDLVRMAPCISRWCRLLPALWLVLSMAVWVPAQRGPVRGVVSSPTVLTPEDGLGFKPGTDRRLALWDQLVSYYHQVDRASDRLRIEEIGRTTLGRPMVLLAVSSPENIANLDNLKKLQQQLSDPRPGKVGGDEPLESPMARGKIFVLVSGGSNPIDVGGPLTVTDLVHRLVTDRSPEINEILDRVVILFAPSLNPDGVDVVTNWYRKTLGTSAEGTNPPEIVHKYAGQDLGQDWNALTQIETRLMVGKVFNVWRPQIWHDLRQTVRDGSRYSLACSDSQWRVSSRSLVAAVSVDLASRGRIVLKGAPIKCDFGTPLVVPNLYGGFATWSEAASARLATPVGQEPDVRLHAAGYSQKRQGGRWSIGDIVDYQSAGVMALLRRVALDREKLLHGFQTPALQSAERNNRRPRDPFAILLLEPEVPKSISEAYQRLSSGLRNVTGSEEEMHQKSEALYESVTGEPSSSREVRYFYQSEGIDRLLGILKTAGIEVLRAGEPFIAAGQSYPAGTHIVPLGQPGAAYARALLTPRRDLPSLPLLLNVRAIQVDSRFSYSARPEPPSIVLQGRVRENGGVRVGLYRNHLQPGDEGWTRWIFDQYRFGYQSIFESDLRSGKLESRFDAIIIPDQLPEELRRSAGSVGDGGLGEAEVSALRDFILAGGTLVTLNRASLFAIEQFQLPVRNVLTARTTDNLSASGSIMRIDVENGNPLGFGVESKSIAWFEKSPVFEITDPKRARAIASYSKSGPLQLSGRLMRDSFLQRLRGRAAMVEVLLGKGRVILFGFRPQYRGQSLTTYPFLFNALMTSSQ